MTRAEKSLREIDRLIKDGLDCDQGEMETLSYVENVLDDYFRRPGREPRDGVK